MLWLVLGQESFQIIGCNIHEKDGLHQLWVEKSNGKTKKIAEHKELAEITLIKGAIDYAIETNETTLQLA